MPREISKMLTLSTAHISAETGRMLEAGDSPFVIAYGYEYGWFVPVTESACTCAEESLTDCFKLAHDNDCTWIRFDCDGPEEVGLKTYDW